LKQTPAAQNDPREAFRLMT